MSITRGRGRILRVCKVREENNIETLPKGWLPEPNKDQVEEEDHEEDQFKQEAA
jgi:hypothetical protein